jgi:hypothetical protein
MRSLGTVQGWSFFEHMGSVAAVDSATLDVTDVLEGATAAALLRRAADEGWRQPEAGPRASVVSDLAAEAFADVLEPAESYPPSELALTPAHDVPQEVRTTAKRGLKVHMHHGGDASAADLTTARLLASGSPVPIELLRHVARHFHLADAGDRPADGLVHSLYGGDAARDWACSLVRRSTSTALLAAAYEDQYEVVDAEVPQGSREADPTVPHKFYPIIDGRVCRYCGADEFSDLHDDRAVDYDMEGLSPDKSHFFTEDRDNPEDCGFCGRPSDDDLHKQAALASYYSNRDFFDDIFAEDAAYRAKQKAAAVTAGARYLPYGRRTRAAEEDLLDEAVDRAEEVFWTRRGHEDEDPLTYFVSEVVPGSMVVDAVYAFDGRSFYILDPAVPEWLPAALPEGEHVYEVDDGTAYGVVLSALSRGGTVDIAELDVPEAALMRECVPYLDNDFYDDVLIAAAPVAAPPPAEDGAAAPGDGYTEEERAQNAARQARDRGGKFAPGGGGGGVSTKPSRTAGKSRARLPVPLRPIGVGGLQALFQGFADYVSGHRGVTAAGSPAAAPPAVPPAVPPPDTGTPVVSPETSDVPAIRMAIMDPGDDGAVLELVVLVPASTTSVAPKLLKRVADGRWEEDIVLLRQLQGLRPPPVVVLEDDATYQDVLSQVDSFFAEDGKAPDAEPAGAVAAAAVYGTYGELIAGGVPGIADTPGDIAAAERLKRYWTVGEGGAKIRWNTPGDWTRAYRHLRKYMGPRAKGYAAELHKLMTGVWPGDRRNIGRRAPRIAASAGDATVVASTSQVIALRASAAVRHMAGSPEPLVASASDADHGARFVIKVLAPVGPRSGDSRKFTEDSLSHRELPLPLLWQVKTGSAHDNSVIVGRIDSVDVLEDGSLGNARGVFDIGTYGAEAERLVRHKFLRGVSVDLDNFEALRARVDREDDEAFDRITQDEMDIISGRMLAATLVAKPAFQESIIELEEEPYQEVAMVADGTFVGDPVSPSELEAMVSSVLAAAGVPLHPPAAWFEDPRLGGKTPLTVEDDGRVFGHIATWDVEHIGLPFSVRPPRSRSNYAYFKTGVLRTAEGSDVHVGQLTLSGGHADGHASAAAAVRHYDDTGSAFADVCAGEDAYGIWVAGALRPSVTGDQLRAIRASAPSGDWRPINGRLEMVAVCQVNVPGFPNTRAVVAGGQLVSLVAAGTSALNIMRSRGSDAASADLLARVETLEKQASSASLEELRNAAIQRVAPVREARSAALQEKMDQLREHVAASQALDEAAAFRNYTTSARKRLADKGEALPDGSYPIATVSDLKNAVSAYGRAKDKDLVRRHIRRRARALGRTDLLPQSWESSAAKDLSLDVEEAEGLLAIIAAGGRYPNGEPWDPKRHPRDDKGKFRTAIARIKKAANDAGKESIEKAADRVAAAEARGDLDEVQQSTERLLKQVDDGIDDIEDIDTAKELRRGYTSLSTAVASMPIAMGDVNQKFRFTDLPPQLQGLIKDLLKRVEAALDNETAEKASHNVKEFISGVDVLSQPDISAELSRMLRYLI